MDEEKQIEEINTRLLRYIDEYGWKWSLVKKIINDYFGTDYSMKQLQTIYARLKAKERAEARH